MVRTGVEGKNACVMYLPTIGDTADGGSEAVCCAQQIEATAVAHRTTAANNLVIFIPNLPYAGNTMLPCLKEIIT
jgi:hypothetical protein